MTKALTHSHFLVSIPERVWGGLELFKAPAKNSDCQVSIPERVWGGLEPIPEAIAETHYAVSIPERVWGGLEPATATLGYGGEMFQSLRGFGVGWSGDPDRH